MRTRLSFCLVLALPALACGSNAPRPIVTTDCSGEGSYKIWSSGSSLIGNFEADTPGMPLPQIAFDTQDSTTGATRSENVELIRGEDGGLEPRCGDSKQALELTAYGYNDWGTTFPLALASFSAYDASGTDGVALWLRAADVTKSFVLTLTDKQAFDPGNGTGECMGQPDAGNDAVDPSSLPLCSGTLTTNCWVQLPNRCADFEFIMTVTSEWALYKIPYAAFTQPLSPADRHTPPDPSGLYIMGFRIPKAAHLDLWVDDIGFYQSK